MTAKLMLRALFVPLIAAFCVFSAGVSMAQSNDAGDRLYELRTYTTLPGRLPALNKRFADHTYGYSRDTASGVWRTGFQLTTRERTTR